VPQADKPPIERHDIAENLCQGLVGVSRAVCGGDIRDLLHCFWQLMFICGR